MMQRRGFLKTLVGLVAGGAAAPVVAAPVATETATAAECAKILAQQFPEEFVFCEREIYRIPMTYPVGNTMTISEYANRFLSEHDDDHGL